MSNTGESGGLREGYGTDDRVPPTTGNQASEGGRLREGYGTDDRVPPTTGPQGGGTTGGASDIPGVLADVGDQQTTDANGEPLGPAGDADLASDATGVDNLAGGTRGTPSGGGTSGFGSGSDSSGTTTTGGTTT